MNNYIMQQLGANYMQELGADWTNVSGVCRPGNKPALDAFKALQSQLNRAAVVLKLSKVDVDGRIGPKTVELYTKVVGPGMYACDMLAVVTTTGASVSMAKAAADKLNAPAVVPPPITSRPSTVAADGSIKDPPLLGITDMAFSLVSSPFGLLIAAGLAFGAYKLATSGKKAPSAPSAPSRPRRARGARRAR